MFHCDDIAPAVRHGLMIVRKLKLHDHTMLTPEKIFASGKIEFPHPYKLLSYKAAIRSRCARNRIRQWCSVSA